MVGEDFWFEVLDLFGVILINVDVKKVIDVYCLVLVKVLEEKFNIYLLGFVLLLSQVFWCCDEIDGFVDLLGKKICVFNVILFDFVGVFGGIIVIMFFVDVILVL